MQTRDASFPKAMVLAASPEELIDEAERNGVPDIVFCDTLSAIEAIMRQHNPDCLAVFHDVDFRGSELAAASHFPSVKWVHCSGAGTDFLGEAPREDIWITNIGTGRAKAQAQTVMGAIIALNRRFPYAAHRQQERVWDPYVFDDLAGQNLLIVGTGAIGSNLAKIAKAMDMNTWGVSRTPKHLVHFDRVIGYDDMDAALTEADVVSLHVPLTAATAQLFDAERLARLKKSAIFVNTARGPIVDEIALAELLQNHSIAGAFLDVFETEPLPVTSSLWHAPNTLIMPHNSNLTKNWRTASLGVFLSHLENWRQRRPLQNIVQRPSGQSE